MMPPLAISPAIPQLTSLSILQVHLPRPPPIVRAVAENVYKICSCSIIACALLAQPAAASILGPPPSAREQQLKALQQLGVAMRQPERVEEESVKVKIERVTALMNEAAEAAETGDWPTTLRSYSDIVERYSDLALAERARVARALVLYQVGRPNDALLQLEGEEVTLRGSAEVHAALAVMFYDKGRPLAAEQQWTVATEFDSRYSDPQWVARERRWPPLLVAALERFLTLS